MDYGPVWRDPVYYGLPERGPITQPRYAAPAPIVVGKPVATTPVSLQQPIVIQQPVGAKPEPKNATVWVEGRYVDQKKPDGTVVRTWQPGHYEQRPLP